MTEAFTICAKKVAIEWRIPLKISQNPFYSERDICCLEGINEDIDTLKVHTEEHELM